MFPNTRLDSKPKTPTGASLVAQWLRIPWPVQETRVRALIREDPTCHGATKPCTTTEARMPRAGAPQQEEHHKKPAPPLIVSSSCSPSSNEDPAQPKRNNLQKVLTEVCYLMRLDGKLIKADSLGEKLCALLWRDE